METRTVTLTRIPVELHKILKFENLAASGGEAKHMIAEGRVKLNGRIETRKQKKIYPGDVIEAEGCRLEMETAAAT
jgi:ribosome-associated protein